MGMNEQEQSKDDQQICLLSTSLQLILSDACSRRQHYSFLLLPNGLLSHNYIFTEYKASLFEYKITCFRLIWITQDLIHILDKAVLQCMFTFVFPLSSPSWSQKAPKDVCSWP